MISVEELFEEDFKPQWMLEKDLLVKQSLEQAITVDVEYKWKMLAKETVRRISAKHPPTCGKVVVMTSRM